MTLHQPLEFTGEYPLLISSDDGGVLAMEWSRDSGSRILAIANGSFLLNEPLAQPSRRPLANKTLDWLGSGKKTVAFIEGGRVLSKQAESPSPYRLLFVNPIGWVSAHIIALLLIACLSRAAILGRPRPDPPSGVDRPSAHPAALGVLLAKARDPDAAHEELDAYRRWRNHRRPLRDQSGRFHEIPFYSWIHRMPISFQCSKCGRAYSVNDGLAGKRVKCRECQEILTIPRLDDVAEGEPLELDARLKPRKRTTSSRVGANESRPRSTRSSSVSATWSAAS